jgi:hypothetical protein
MADIFLGEFDVDILPPVVTEELPAPGTVDVSLFTDISFKIQDQGGSSVDIDSLDVTVDGQPAITAGVFQLGFGGTITPIPSGWDVVIDPGNPLNLDSLIETTIDAQDQASIPNIMPTFSWVFQTNEGLIESPSLSALPGNENIQLQWSLPPPTQMLQELFRLVRNLEAFPTSVDQGELVYEGLERQYLDVDVDNGIRYYYTVFVVRRFVDGVPDYVPYETRASATAVPRQVLAQTIKLAEYVPERGEFGPSAHPVPHGTLNKTWGVLEDGVRRQSDTFRVRASREVQAPMRGTVTEVGELPSSSPVQRVSYVDVTNDRGMVVRVSGFFPLPDIVGGQTVVPGQVMGRTTSSEIEIAVFKKPVSTFGKRTVRPSKFFLAIETRDGRT